MIMETMAKIKTKVEYGTAMLYLHDRLAGHGIDISPFYVMREDLSGGLECKNSPEPGEYSFGEFTGADLEEIARLPGEGTGIDVLRRMHENGKKCYGLKNDGRIVAFSWVDFDECGERYINFKLNGNEAYLFHLFVHKPYRGRNLAVYLRSNVYRMLKDNGKDTILSIVDYFNAPAIRFKEKINASKSRLGLHLELFGKYSRTWIIKTYAR